MVASVCELALVAVLHMHRPLHTPLVVNRLAAGKRCKLLRSFTQLIAQLRRQRKRAAIAVREQ